MLKVFRSFVLVCLLFFTTTAVKAEAILDMSVGGVATTFLLPSMLPTFAIYVGERMTEGHKNDLAKGVALTVTSLGVPVTLVFGGPFSSLGATANGLILGVPAAVAMVIIANEMFLDFLVWYAYGYDEIQEEALQYLSEGNASERYDRIYDEFRETLLSLGHASEFFESAGVERSENPEFFDAVEFSLNYMIENGISKQEFSVSLQAIVFQ